MKFMGLGENYLAIRSNQLARQRIAEQERIRDLNAKELQKDRIEHEIKLAQDKASHLDLLAQNKVNKEILRTNLMIRKLDLNNAGANYPTFNVISRLYNVHHQTTPQLYALRSLGCTPFPYLNHTKDFDQSNELMFHSPRYKLYKEHASLHNDNRPHIKATTVGAMLYYFEFMRDEYTLQGEPGLEEFTEIFTSSYDLDVSHLVIRYFAQLMSTAIAANCMIGERKAMPQFSIAKIFSSDDYLKLQNLQTLEGEFYRAYCPNDISAEIDIGLCADLNMYVTGRLDRHVDLYGNTISPSNSELLGGRVNIKGMFEREYGVEQMRYIVSSYSLIKRNVYGSLSFDEKVQLMEFSEQYPIFYMVGHCLTTMFRMNIRTFKGLVELSRRYWDKTLHDDAVKNSTLTAKGEDFANLVCIDRFFPELRLFKARNPELHKKSVGHEVYEVLKQLGLLLDHEYGAIKIDASHSNNTFISCGTILPNESLFPVFNEIVSARKKRAAYNPQNNELSKVWSRKLAAKKQLRDDQMDSSVSRLESKD
ncbi:hypothetical protein AB4491_03390 [Vibrio sp. 10N.261.45.A7]